MYQTMLKPELLRELTLDTRAHPQHRPWLSAASGLVCTGTVAYVVADDELSLGCFPFARPWSKQLQQAPVQLLPVLAGELPLDHKLRKQAKPDLECLLLLPCSTEFPHGALLALGSGSNPNRCRALLLALNANGELTDQRHVFDLSEFYAPLHNHFDEPNIEGMFLDGTQLRLLQRGNKGHNQSACISYDFSEFLDWTLKHRHDPPAILAVLPLNFGSVEGVPLCPTDAVSLPEGGWVASLVAEDTDSSYHDGRCVGSALAVMDTNDRLSELHMLANSPKVVGLALLSNAKNSPIELLMVTDADDPALPAQLLRVTMQVSKTIG